MKKRKTKREDRRSRSREFGPADNVAKQEAEPIPPGDGDEAVNRQASDFPSVGATPGKTTRGGRRVIRKPLLD